ncbi:hypothetical protein GGF42_009038, partial [Coemansia sp. RSA 2424]
MNLNLTSESCVGVKAFEMWAASALQKSADDKQDEQMAELPVLIVALTTYVKRPNEIRNRTTDELGSYRLYALGADSLPPLSQEFVDRHALRPQESVLEGSSSGGGCRRSRSHSESMSPPQRRPTQLPPTVPLAETESLPGFATSPPLDMAAATAASDATRRASISHAAEAADLLAGGGFGSDDGEAMTGAGDFPGGKNTQAEAALLPINTYAYLEERLFSLKVNERTAFLDLDYLPFRISQDVAPGMPAVLLVAGNDNKVHRYALGCDRIVEIEPLLCPKTDVSLTFTAFDARVIGPYHVQITAHQEFAVALQASRALTSDEMASEEEKEEEKEEKAEKKGSGRGDSALRRRLLIADEEVYDAAPILTTVFTPEAKQLDRTAFDYAITHRVRERKEGEEGIMAGDVYDSNWPIGTMGAAPSRVVGMGQAPPPPPPHTTATTDSS